MTNDEHIAQLVPAMQPLARALLQQAQSQGYELRITSSYRSHEEQAQLYANGRGSYTYNGLVYHAQSPRIVTYTQPGYSAHNHRRAFDVVERTRGYALDWTPLGKLGESLGLIWGGRFPTLVDSTHFEYRGPAEATITAAVVTAVTQPNEEEDMLATPDEVRSWFRQYLGREAGPGDMIGNRRKTEFLAGACLELQARLQDAANQTTLPPERVRELYQEKLGRTPENDSVLVNRHLSEFLDGAVKEWQNRYTELKASIRALVT